MDRSSQIPEILPDVLPALSAAEMVLLPGAVVALQLEGSSAIAEAEIKKSDKLFVVVSPEGDGHREIGTLARVIETGNADRGRALLVRALARVKIGAVVEREPVLKVRVEKLHEPELVITTGVQALMLEAKKLSNEILALIPGALATVGAELDAITDPSLLADLFAFRVPAPAADKQQVLEELNVEKRLALVVAMLGKRRELLKVTTDIDSSVRKNVSKVEHEHMLRQRRKAIEQELKLLQAENGEEPADEIEVLTERLKKAQLSPELRTQVDRELKRLAAIPEASPERSVARTWLSWIADLPWGVVTPDVIDLKAARAVLDADHEGLGKIKKRIESYLAVRGLKGDMKGPILCLVGPPGVGKTSLGQSIAHAMGRKFVRVSLGGVRDEAELRGHRRTYVGAMPGRLVAALKRAGSMNPVVMLDEIDKLGGGSTGDPAAALLEVLDPEQNNTFTDHYLEVPLDLSKVLFIATANTLETVAGPLRDRMELLELPGYALSEKIAIATAHLWPKQLKEHGLDAARISLAEGVMRGVIEGYTREAGVRNLEQRLAGLARHLAVEKASGQLGDLVERVVTLPELELVLGPPDFEADLMERANIAGVATGLGWSPSGGSLLFIEATEMPGNGKVIVTGQLGSVMKESTQAAFSYLRAHATEYGLAADPLADRDLHLHFPDGGTKKDGPSAGVTIFTALVSLLTGIRVRGDVAMTGETTLRGRVLPVGGIKEKVLAAHRAGIKRLILPERCAADLRDVPESVKSELEFVFVQRLEQVLEAALERSPIASTRVAPLPETPSPRPSLRAA
jgi:ATP-dependent Lon protease